MPHAGAHAKSTGQNLAVSRKIDAADQLFSCILNYLLDIIVAHVRKVQGMESCEGRAHWAPDDQLRPLMVDHLLGLRPLRFDVAVPRITVIRVRCVEFQNETWHQQKTVRHGCDSGRAVDGADMVPPEATENVVHALDDLLRAKVSA